MAGDHLKRTGYRHGVLLIAALSALVAAMYTQSSFVHPVSETEYSISPITSDAYIKPHQFSIAMIILNAITCALTTLMSLIIDWHFAIHTPAYVEFGWVGLAAGLELASVVLAGISAPQAEVCSLDKTSFGVYEGLVTSGRRVCSNWTAVLVTSVISLIMFIFHFMWHIIFRLWHRAALARRPTAPIDLWNTPIPKYYPINPQETVKREDAAFLALGERGIKPEDSIVMDPYSRIFKPVAVRKAEKLVKNGTIGHEMPVVNVIVSIEDREAKCVQGNASETTLNAPPGIELNMKGPKLHSPSD
ncbi:unnamed protein product [Rhizoctonia solani]|uniref:Uncharacterized protein n=1 Tax=Rhizoctonia solani TaxID=456999 RepID=A0A8H3A0G4_9AGAM|nr:unnamed protein product [Rhizoctonia solani]